MIVNIDKSQIMKISKSNESLPIKTKLKVFDRFKYLGSVLSIYAYCTREMKMTTAMNTEAFNRKISLRISKLNITQGQIGQLLYLEHCTVGLRDLDPKKIGAKIFGEPPNVVLEENGGDQKVRVLVSN